MARNIKNTNTTSAWETVTDGIQVKLSKGRFFSLTWFGAVIHGCKIVNGCNGAFISWPYFKGSDGKYVKRAYVFAPQGSQDEKLLEMVVSKVQSLS